MSLGTVLMSTTILFQYLRPPPQSGWFLPMVGLTLVSTGAGALLVIFAAVLLLRR